MRQYVSGPQLTELTCHCCAGLVVAEFDSARAENNCGNYFRTRWGDFQDLWLQKYRKHSRNSPGNLTLLERKIIVEIIFGPRGVMSRTCGCRN